MSGWYQFVSAVRICLSWTLTGKNVQEIRKKLHMFYHHYTREYSGNNIELLSAHRIVFHYLLHVADSIQDYGPPWSFWQFPMERYCGMLIPLVRSKTHPYVSLTNQVKLREQLNHIQFNSSFTSMVRNSSASWVLDNILGLPDYVEELYWPKRKYMLDELEYRRLREHYATFHEIALSEVKVSFVLLKLLAESIKLRTKDGHILGSKKCRKYSDDFRCINYTVAAIMLIDRYAKYHKRPEELVEKELYAEVEFYFHRIYRGRNHMLAYVHWAGKCERDRYDIRSFTTRGSWEFVEVTVLDRCVGWIQKGRTTYIVDKEHFTSLISGE
ncbi:uncharacterized protein VTP21DRAFT_8939 [Calcarisporiella thermophila]|uniref:uncharacterized protein n=1 Tax=Calcarisporiella thermophila TaxID=911321 RepID=UPI003743A08B